MTNAPLQLPAAPWLGHDPERGDLHGFSHEEVRALIAEAREKLLAALRTHICDPRGIEYAPKIIHLVGAPSHQNWVANLWMPDPLPDPYDADDLRAPRLTPEQAFDRLIKELTE